MQDDKPKELIRPQSTTNFWINCLGVIFFFIGLFLTRNYGLFTQVISSVSALLAPVLLYEIFIAKIYKQPTTGLTTKRPINNNRVMIKLLGLTATLAMIAFFYWLLPEYRSGFYTKFFLFVKYVLPFLLLFSWSYFTELDIRMADPHDGYYMMGCFCLGKWSRIRREVLFEHFRQWGVKAFFLPLMFIYMTNNFVFLREYNYANLSSNFIAFYDYMYGFIFTVDLAFACVGYMFTFKLFDTHIRSAEPTLLGWIVAVMCYKPFWEVLFYHMYFSYNDGFYWGSWLSEYPTVKIFWGLTILGLITIYSFSTISLGLRFSNLTYRGLVTNGPYRFSKHPAYITKNISWWMISIPFISSADFFEALRMCILLLGVNIIYYIRARTEENHLSNYPEYVEYAKWINKHGLLRWLNRPFPYFCYSEERAKSWGSRIKHKVDGYNFNK